MKKLILFIICFQLLACNDGDFEVPSFEFTETIGACSSSPLLYRLSSSGTEGLIITLSSNDLENKAQTKSNLTLNSTRTITYRVFDEKATGTYFCSAVPPTTPTVLKNWEATDGYFEITSEEIDSTHFKHTIVIYDLVLKNGEDKLVYDEYVFGTVSTSI